MHCASSRASTTSSTRPARLYRGRADTSSQRVVARNFGVRCVEVHLRLGPAGEPPVTPPHLDVARDGLLSARRALAHDRAPVDHRLAARARMYVERAELE